MEVVAVAAAAVLFHWWTYRLRGGDLSKGMATKMHNHDSSDSCSKWQRYNGKCKQTLAHTHTHRNVRNKKKTQFEQIMAAATGTAATLCVCMFTLCICKLIKQFVSWPSRI